MSKENVEISLRAVDAFNRRDPVSFAELCVPEVEIVPLRAAIEGTVYRGPDSVSRFFAESDELWEQLHVEDVEIRDLGERVLAFATLRARGRASGVIVERRLGWIFDLSDGLIAAIRTYLSVDEALKAAGLSE